MSIAAEVGVMQNRLPMDLSIWKKAKDLMLPFDGGATQIHVLGISKSNVMEALDVIERSTENPRCSLLASKVLDCSIALRDLYSDVGSRAKVTEGQSTITATIFESADVTFDFWGEVGEETYDLEVWFWADQVFTEDEKENYNRFSSLLSVLKNTTADGDCQCILTPSEASDPLEDVEKGYGLLLDLKCA